MRAKTGYKRAPPTVTRAHWQNTQITRSAWPINTIECMLCAYHHRVHRAAAESQVTSLWRGDATDACVSFFCEFSSVWDVARCTAYLHSAVPSGVGIAALGDAGPRLTGFVANHVDT